MLTAGVELHAKTAVPGWLAPWLVALLLIGCGGDGGGSGVDVPVGSDASVVVPGDEGGRDGGSLDAGVSCPLPADLPDDPAVVATSLGAVRGVRKTEVFAFLGIPYARPPVGDRRWMPPSPRGCFDLLFDAAAFGPSCPQIDPEGGFTGSEDCLTLNIWTPASAPRGTAARPVLVFVHGGGNIQGGSASRTQDGTHLYDGAALAEATGAVVVTLNYRLGPLGFLALAGAAGEPLLLGNQGIQDQIAALTWVRDHVLAFGGDPARTLVFGESAGAVDTCVLLTSPRAEGLFSAALMESGACLARTRTEAEQTGADLVAELGCADQKEPLACLRAVPVAQVAAALYSQPGASSPQGRWQPSVDGDVVPEDPYEALRAGRHNRVPFVVGANSAETALSAPKIKTVAQYRKAVNALLGPALGAKALALYPASDFGSPREAYIRLTTDAKFVCTARRNARAAAESQEEPVWLYLFSHGLENSAVGKLGAWHGLELVFVFGHLEVAGYTPSEAERALSATLQGYWANLAASGDPNAAGAPAWPTYSAEADAYLELRGGSIHAARGYRADACAFWETVYEALSGSR